MTSLSVVSFICHKTIINPGNLSRHESAAHILSSFFLRICHGLSLLPDTVCHFLICPHLQTQRLLAEGEDESLKRSWFQDHEERQLLIHSKLLGKEPAALKKDLKGKHKTKTQRKKESSVSYYCKYYWRREFQRLGFCCTQFQTQVNKIFSLTEQNLTL